ncbi:MAG: SCO6880 family protein [Acidimicrobiales bacterium]
MATDDDVTYDYGVPAHRAVFLGLGIERIAIIAAGLLLMTFAVIAGVPIPIAIFPLLVAIAIAFVRIKGRRLQEWAPVMLRWGRTTLSGTRSWKRGLPVGRLASSRSSSQLDGPEKMTDTYPLVPGSTFAETRVLGMPLGVVVVEAARARALTAVFSVTGHSTFALLPRDEQAAAISSWGSLLSETCVRSAQITSIEWVERTVPDLASEAEQWMRAHLSPSALGTAGLDDYANLLDDVEAVACTHEVYVSVQISSKLADLPDAMTEAAPQWVSIANRLSALGLITRPLSQSDVKALLQASADGIAFHPGDSRNVDPSPMAIDEQWDYLRVDGLFHRVFAVTAWPRVRVWPSFLEPLLLASSAGSLRTVSVHLHPVEPETARRRARAAVAMTALDEQSRHKAGFVISSQHRREADDAERREAELVAGYGEHQIGAVTMVSAPTKELLEAGSRALVQGAVQSMLDLRVLYGSQRDGYVAALPLAHLGFARTVV